MNVSLGYVEMSVLDWKAALLLYVQDNLFEKTDANVNLWFFISGNE